MLKGKLCGITLYVHEYCNDKAARYLKVEWCHYGDVKYLLFRQLVVSSEKYVGCKNLTIIAHP